jgi:DNA-binding IclR family transcriptional regulator
MKGDQATPDAGDNAASRRYRIEAVTRAAQILACLDENAGSDVATIAARAHATEAFVSSALSALERRGLARHDPAERWSLGLGWLRLATAGRRQMDLREIAQPVMRRMRDDVDETVVLAVRRGSRRVNIDFAESTQDVRRQTQIGTESPLYAGAAGRVLLSGFSSRDLADYLVSVAASDGKIIAGLDIAAYTREVESVSTAGYSRAVGEFTVDLCAVSTPIRDHTGDVVAALSISCPVDRFNDGLEKTCVRTVMEGALEVSRLIGFPGKGLRAESI